MKTPSAEGDPERAVDITVHLAELYELEQCVSYFIRNAPRHFDSASHSFKLKDLVGTLRKMILEKDPEYQQFISKDKEKGALVYPPGTIIREVHHHHYPATRPQRHTW